MRAAFEKSMFLKDFPSTILVHSSADVFRSAPLVTVLSPPTGVFDSGAFSVISELTPETSEPFSLLLQPVQLSKTVAVKSVISVFSYFWCSFIKNLLYRSARQK